MMPCSTSHIGPNQCGSTVTQSVSAPITTVWSIISRFENPQAYKHFLKSWRLIFGHGDVGTLREVLVVSGLPADYSTERLEISDDRSYTFGFRIVGGEHRLTNYSSVTRLYQVPNCSGDGTIVVESYVVDVPEGNSVEDTCAFVDTIVKCNLQSLAHKFVS